MTAPAVAYAIKRTHRQTGDVEWYSVGRQFWSANWHNRLLVDRRLDEDGWLSCDDRKVWQLSVVRIRRVTKPKQTT